MDFDKTSFSVDWYAPGDKYAPKRLSFPKSACISTDDLLPDSPLSLCFSPIDGAFLRPRTASYVDTPSEMTRGWASSAPPSPLVPPDHEQYATYDPDLRPCEDDEDGTDWRALASPGILSVADDCALCGVDLDVSCLDALDEQLLLSPVACFTELCWAAAVCDDATAPVLHRHTRARVRSFKGASERPAPPCPREYPGSFERCRPLAARIVVPIDRSPCYPLSAPCASDATFAVFQDKKARAYFPDADARGLPVQGVPMPRRVKKRAPMAEPRASSQPATPIKSSHTLRVITDAYSTLTRARRRSPHKVV